MVHIENISWKTVIVNRKIAKFRKRKQTSFCPHSDIHRNFGLAFNLVCNYFSFGLTSHIKIPGTVLRMVIFMGFDKSSLYGPLSRAERWNGNVSNQMARGGIVAS